MKTPTPFRFDGHGINDAEGQRIAKVSSCEPYVYTTGQPMRNPEFDELSNLFAAAPDLRDACIKVMHLSGFIGGFVSRPQWWSDDVAWEEWVEASEAVRAALREKR